MLNPCYRIIDLQAKNYLYSTRFKYSHQQVPKSFQFDLNSTVYGKSQCSFLSSKKTAHVRPNKIMSLKIYATKHFSMDKNMSLEQTLEAFCWLYRKYMKNNLFCRDSLFKIGTDIKQIMFNFFKNEFKFLLILNT